MIAAEQDRGHWLVGATEKALWFAGDDDDKLLAVCFCAALQEWGLEFFWDLNNPLVIEVGADLIEARADRSTTYQYDTVQLPHVEAAWTLTGRVMRGPNTTLVLLIGITATEVLRQATNDNGESRVTAFLTLSDWRAQFPQFWKGVAA